MKTKKNVIVCGYDFFKDNRKYGLHFLTEYFAKDNRVLFITVRNFYIDVLKKHFSSKYRIKKYPKRYGNLVNYLSYKFVPPFKGIPILDSYWYAKCCLLFTFPSIKKILEKSEFNKCDILIFETNSMMAIKSLIKSEHSIYRLCDPYNGFKWVTDGQLQYEEFIIKTVDVVLPVSKALYDFAVRIRGSKEGVYLLPNGVLLDNYSSLKLSEVPIEYTTIKKPIAVYVGTFPFWFDWDLLINTANQSKDFSFVIIGAGRIPKRLPDNIYCVGYKKYSDLPKYLKNADVGMIPFKNVERMKYVECPLKYYQYLASGLPVVSVPYGGLKCMRYAKFAKNPEEFSKQLYASLETSQDEKKSYIVYATRLSWESIFSEFEKILQKEKIL